MHTDVITFHNWKATRIILFRIPPLFKIFYLSLQVSHPMIGLRNNFEMFSTIFTLLAIFLISTKHSNLTWWNFSCCSRMLTWSRVTSHSTFLLLLIYALRLTISSFNLLLSNSSYKIFSLNTMTLWVVACDNAIEAIATVTRSSSVFPNKTSSS